MPNITEFNAGNLAIRPSETGVEAFAAAGRRIGAFYNQEGQAIEGAGARIGRGIRDAGDAAVAYMDHQQINAGADHGTTLLANWTDNWNQTAASADPHDPSVAKRWREEQFEPAAQQFLQGFTTERSQNWANEFVNRARQHFFVKTEADMSSLAKEAVSNTVRNMANENSNTVFKDPSALPTILDQIDHSIDGVLGANPNIKGPDAGRVRLEVGEKLKEQIVRAAVQGVIVKGGDWQRLANDPRYKPYLDAPAMEQFEKQDRYYTRIAESEAKHKTAQEVADNKTQANEAEKKIQMSLIPDGNTPAPQPQELHNALRSFGQMPGTTPGQLQRMTTDIEKYIKRLGQPDQPSQKDNYDFLASKLFDPNHPLTVHDIVQNIDGLSKADAAKLKWSVNALQTEEMKNPLLVNAMTGAKQIINGTTAAERQMSAGNYAAFVNNFLPEYLKQARAGTLPPNALDFNDEKSLISMSMKPYRNSIAAAVSANGGIGLPTYTAPKPEANFTPPPNWMFSPSRNQYRDPGGKIYDATGRPI